MAPEYHHRTKDIHHNGSLTGSCAGPDHAERRLCRPFRAGLVPMVEQDRFIALVRSRRQKKFHGLVFFVHRPTVGEHISMAAGEWQRRAGHQAAAIASVPAPRGGRSRPKNRRYHLPRRVHKSPPLRTGTSAAHHSSSTHSTAICRK